MRAARLGLSVLFGSLATLSVGIGEAWSQTALLRVCNQSSITASVAVTARLGPGDSRWLIKGWWTIHPGSCSNTTYVPWGWFYVYAQSYAGGDTEWRGDDKRFCVHYPGPFERLISPSYTCGPDRLKSFSGFYAESEMFTWTLE
jgi:uncharacterized membrane protein